MFGIARHSLSSGQTFPTERTINYSWRNKHYLQDSVWKDVPVKGSILETKDFSNRYGLTNWTLAYWFKFVENHYAPGFYSNNAAPFISGVAGRGAPAGRGSNPTPFVSKTYAGVGGNGSTNNLVSVNLSNDVWYSAIFSYDNTSDTLDIYINGNRIYRGTGGDPLSFWLSTVDRTATAYFDEATLFADCWLDDAYYDFYNDLPRLRYFYDYRIAKPSVSGDFTAQQDTTNLSEGDNRGSGNWTLGSWTPQPLGFNFPPGGGSEATSGISVFFTDTPTS